MKVMFDRFTEEAKKTMSIARATAQDYQYDSIGPRHVLRGLCSKTI